MKQKHGADDNDLYFCEIMNLLNVLTGLYGKLHNYPGLPYWFLTPFRRTIRWLSKWMLPKYLSNKGNRGYFLSSDVIVSLTSFPARINNVWQVVECMKRQSVRPLKIILWLSKEQFSTIDSIPQTLKSEEDDIFEIRLVDGDIRSHKKYYYVSKEYPDSHIFLIDDDIYYSSDILQKTLDTSKANPEALICNYGYKMKFSGEKKLRPYREWIHKYGPSRDPNLFFGSGGGTLFKPSNMYKDLTDIKTAVSLCPLADDIWLNAMARLSNQEIILLKNGNILPVYNENNVKLMSENLNSNQNDSQLANVISYYLKKVSVNPFECR